MKKPFAVVSLVAGDGAALQRRRHRKGLEHGARLVGIHNAEIFPQRIQVLVHDLVVHPRDRFLRHIFRYAVRLNPFPVLVKKRHPNQILRISDVV